MKTSTKIILLYCSLFFASLLTLYILSKTHKSEEQKWTFVNSEKGLPDFSVVVLKDSTRCRLEMAEYNHINWQTTNVNWQTTNDKPLVGEPVIVRNDTLYVTTIPKELTYDYVIKCKGLKVVITNPGSSVRIIDPVMNKLTLIGKGGEIYVENEDSKKGEQLAGRLQIELFAMNYTQTNIDVRVNKINASLNNSVLNARNVVMISRNVTLNLRNASKVEFSNCPLQLNVIKDSTSNLTLY